MMPSLTFGRQARSLFHESCCRRPDHLPRLVLVARSVRSSINRPSRPACTLPSPEMDDIEKELEILERILIDEHAEPTMLSYALLKKITNDFSQEIGSGGFGVVYMGVVQKGR
ncbi:hypothetical protein BRADI_4g24011v3 [Brachypodium distachyon]|uniref:Protein kinase domain-containing protein n=1 Tax=Brachypodium distachyon TaxID=15368 RepID=A0A0Q3ENY5_BRADI|nr:hypothetical protein BRADI_4g24011v3 [Brachypodium distachyon]